jgi:molybdopterin converting factor small subunit
VAARKDQVGNETAMASDTAQITARFITIMQEYSGKGNREVEMQLPTEANQAVAFIIEKFQIPWYGDLEKQARIFIAGLTYDAFLASGEELKDGDTIAFIPISGGG